MKRKIDKKAENEKLRKQIRKEIQKANRRISTFAKPEYATTSAYDSVQNKLRKHSYGIYNKKEKVWKFTMKRGLSNQSLKKELSALKIFNSSITAREYTKYVKDVLARDVFEQELIKKTFQRADNLLDRELFDSRVVQSSIEEYNNLEDGSFFSNYSLEEYMNMMLEFEKEKIANLDEIEASKIKAEKQAKFLADF